MRELDLQRFLKRVIIASWVSLGCCFLIKIFGGNIFEIMVNNERFVTICTYADNRKWAFFLNGFVYCIVSLYFFVLAMCERLKFTKIETIIFVATVLFGSIIKTFSNIFGLIFDIWQLILMPCVFIGRNYKKYINVVIGNVLLVAFQMISLVTKNVELGVLSNSVLVGNIFSIDVLIMLILYYGYVNIIKIKKGER